MVELKYEPVPHNHKAFLKNAQKREGFSKAYNDLEGEYTLVREMLSARSKSGLKWLLPLLILRCARLNTPADPDR